MLTSRLEWLPDETVFSFCSRWHAISGHTVAHQTTRTLFQHHQQGSAHDLPPRLNYFSSRFDGNLGTSKEIALEHTILPFFFPFLPEVRREKALHTMSGEDHSHLKYHLGLLTSNQGASHPLKACADCLYHDLDNVGTTYWHLSHQLPGSSVCLIHQKPLLLAKDKTYGLRRFQWVLPSEALLSSPDKYPDETIQHWLRFEGFIQNFFKSGASGQYFAPHQVTEAGRRQLIEKGFCGKGRKTSLDWKRASYEFLNWVSPLQGSPYIEFIPDTERKALLLLQRTLLSVRSNTHPLNRLFFIAWAFGDWSVFEAKYAEAATSEARPEPELEREDPYALKRSHALKLLAKGKSARSVSTRIGVDTQTVICWGRAAGYDIQKKPQQGKAADIALAKLLLSEGSEKPDIETETGLSRATINRILRCDTKLSQRWNQQRDQRLLEKHRRQWNDHSHRNPTFSTKQLRFINPSVYAWLYRNDRDWLLAQNATTNTGISGNNSAISWDERDLDFAKQVRVAALQFYQTHPGQKLSRNLLLRSVPDLGKKLKHLSRLPKTKDALVKALNPREALKNYPDFFGALF